MILVSRTVPMGPSKKSETIKGDPLYIRVSK